MPSTKKKKYFRKKKKSPAKKIVRTQAVEKAILETLGYRSVFDYPMSFYQLSNYLIGKKKVKPEVLKQALKNLENQNKIKSKVEKYYLTKNKIVPWKERYNNSQRLLKRAERVANILRKIPWIKFIGVTGSVAASNGTKNDDIDFFIVTTAKRVWITRGFTFLILKILGLLRTDKDPDRKICPNIFVDETNLAWNKKGRNIYTAHEIIMIHPIFDREDTYFNFLQKNDWAFNYFSNQPFVEYNLKRNKLKKNLLMNLVEEWAYTSQLSYMKGKKTKEVTNRNIIHFNKVDNTEPILSAFKKSKV